MIRITIEQDEGTSTHRVVVDSVFKADGGDKTISKKLAPYHKEVFHIDELRQLIVRQEDSDPRES